MELQQRPIGYWLKHLDRLIDQAAERALAEEHLTRRQDRKSTRLNSSH